MMASQHKPYKIPWHLILIFIVLSIGISVAGYFYYKDQKDYIKKEKQDELTAITDLKVKQIVNWRRERLGDAAVVSESPFIGHHARQFFENPQSTSLKQEILTWMTTLLKTYKYQNIVLIDTVGNIRLAVPDGEEMLGPDAKRYVEQVMQTKNVIFSDFYRSKITEDIRISLIVPLTNPRGPDSPPIGILLLRIDPNQFLYPLIQSWPTPSKTAETLLVRREGDEVAFLNELRHRKHTSMNLRFPTGKENMPASIAARGIEGSVEGIDYRGVPVLAAVLSVPDTNWFLVAKVDHDEFFSILYKRARFIAIIIISFITAAGLGIGLIWRHQNAEFYQKQYEIEHERQLYLQRYEYITKYANDIMLFVDREGKIMDFNERTVTTYGYTRDELLQMNLKDLRTPETRSLLNGQMREVEAHNGLVFETMHQRNDRTVFPVEVSSRIIRIDGNKYYQSIIRDISERKQAEEALRESEAKYRHTLDYMLEGCQIIGFDWRYLYLNDTADKHNRRPKEELLGKKYIDMWPDIESTQVFAVIQRCMEERVPQSKENEFTFPDGSKGWFELKIYPVPEGIVILSIDITERKQSEEALRSLSSRQEAILTSVPDIIMETDTNKVYTWANKAGLEFFGENVIGKDAAFYFEEEQETYKTVQPLFNGSEEIIYVESWQRRKDGAKRLLAWWCKVLKDEKGNVAGALSTAQDITERKRVEVEIRKLNEELEQRVVQRTTQLETANKELEAFSYSVSHDLRAPLRHISGFMELLKKGASKTLDEKSQHYLNVISDSATQMGMLIDDLLSFSQMGRVEMMKTRVNLNQLVKEAKNQLQHEMEGRDIVWNIGHLPMVYGDPTMFRLVLGNLISNALKFTRPRMQAQIEIGYTSTEDEFIFYIRDSGVGFDMNYASKLFVIFQRLHRKDEFEGTGVGLANVRRIIHRHGGTTCAEGKVDEGATFYFTLPKDDYTDDKK